VLNPTPAYRTPRFWRWFITGTFFLLWVVFFRGEIWWLLQAVVGLFKTSTESQAFNIRRALIIVLTSIGLFAVYLFLTFAIISQFVLPVRTWIERRMAFERLLLFFFRLHGAAVFVREGKIIGSQAELESLRPGVAVLDTKSAIVLEREPYLSATGADISQQESSLNMSAATIHAIFGGPDPDPNAVARAAGPGLVFTGMGERIRGVVSLRNHVRVQPNTRSLTLDGFEVAATIVAVFTLGEPPEVLQACYFDEPAEEGRPARRSIRQIEIRERRNNAGVMERTVGNLSDSFDESDIQEILSFANRAINDPVPPRGRQENQLQRVEPYLFDPIRVFQAIYSDARRPADDGLESWYDLPLRVAIETYHKMIAQNRYSSLYMPENLGDFPLNTAFMPEFRTTVRNQGVLAFQFVRRRDNQPIQSGQTWNEEDLIFYPVQTLRNSKILRDRGIRVMAATFSEISPVNPSVRQQMLDYWRSKRIRRSDQIRSYFDAEEIRIRARARAVAQRNIVMTLRGILEDTSISEEAMAFKVLESIEQFAKDPATEKLLPQESIGMLNTMYDWIWRNRSQPPRK